MAFRNYYEILGLTPAATTEEIRLAYREMSAKYKAETNTADEFNAVMLKSINEAIEVLINPEKRRDYDKTLNVLEQTSLVNEAEIAKKHNVKPEEVERIIDLTQKYFDKEKILRDKYESLLAAQNRKPVKHFTSVKVIFMLLIIAGTTYYYHPEYFKFLKGTEAHERRSYEWITNDSTLIYAKPNLKAKVIWGVPVGTGFNGISETTYFIKITFTDKDSVSREGYIRKKFLEKSKELDLPIPE